MLNALKHFPRLLYFAFFSCALLCTGYLLSLQSSFAFEADFNEDSIYTEESDLEEDEYDDTSSGMDADWQDEQESQDIEEDDSGGFE